MNVFHIKRGLRLSVPGGLAAGTPEGKATAHAALVALDFRGVRPDVRVEVGVRVAAGETLWCDRKRPEIRFTAPVSGVVSAIHRGAKRQLASVVVERDDREGLSFAAPDASPQAVRAWLMETGLWTTFCARPYGGIPDPKAEPVALFVTALDGEALAPYAEMVIALHGEAFAEGLKTILQITQAPVVLCASPGAAIADVPDGVRRVDFSGSPASALPGTHIHWIAPVAWQNSGLAGQAWSIAYQNVIAIGHARLTGRLWGERVVALAGPVVARPRLLRVPTGACVSEIASGELSPGAARLIAGGALSGRAAFDAQDFLGAAHTQVLALVDNKPACEGGTALGGCPGPVLPVPGLERVWPFDIPVIPLMRALSAGDDETVRDLGGLALLEEDVAALTYTCPSKNEYGVLLRRALDRLRKAEEGS